MNKKIWQFIVYMTVLIGITVCTLLSQDVSWYSFILYWVIIGPISIILIELIEKYYEN